MSAPTPSRAVRQGLGGGVVLVACRLVLVSCTNKFAHVGKGLEVWVKLKATRNNRKKIYTYNPFLTKGLHTMTIHLALS